MITLYVKKIWYGDGGSAKVTLRSYEIDRALKSNQPVTVVYDGLKMVLSPRQLAKPVHRRFFKSKIGKEDYELLDYKWRPETQREQEFYTS